MKTYVFHHGQLIGEYVDTPKQFDYPIGAYVYQSRYSQWYYVQRVSLQPINLADVPKELLALMLLLDIH